MMRELSWTLPSWMVDPPKLDAEPRPRTPELDPVASVVAGAIEHLPPAKRPVESRLPIERTEANDAR